MFKMEVNEKYRIAYGVTLAFVGAIFFSAKAVTVKLAYRYGVDAVELLNLRMLFSLPFFLVAGWYAGKNSHHHEKLSKQDWYYIILLGFAGYYLASLFDFVGLEYISAGLERLIVFVYPTIVVLISAYVFKQKIGRKEIIALVLTYMGIALVLTNSFDLSVHKNVWLGSILVFGSAVTYAIYLVGSGRLIPKVGTVRYTSYAMTVSCIVVVVHYLFHTGFQIEIYPWEVYALSIFMAIFSTVLPAFFVSESIRVIGSGHTSIIASIGPVSTLTLANIFLGEEITFVEVIGTALVLGGVWIVSKK